MPKTLSFTKTIPALRGRSNSSNWRFTIFQHENFLQDKTGGPGNEKYSA